jgi:hypothetical protein
VKTTLERGETRSDQEDLKMFHLFFCAHRQNKHPQSHKELQMAENKKQAPKYLLPTVVLGDYAKDAKIAGLIKKLPAMITAADNPEDFDTPLHLGFVSGETVDIVSTADRGDGSTVIVFHGSVCGAKKVVFDASEKEVETPKA